MWQTGAGFGAAAVTGLFGNELLAAAGNPLAPRAASATAKAKSVIFLFM
jgi:hypothetical protein